MKNYLSLKKQITFIHIVLADSVTHKPKSFKVKAKKSNLMYMSSSTLRVRGHHGL